MRGSHLSINTNGSALGSLILLASLLSCGVSANNAERINLATQAVASQLQHGDFDAVYQSATEVFRRQQNLQDWRAWTGSVREKWGTLQHVSVSQIKRLAPGRDVYIVDTVMEYERGRTNGRFTFILEHQTPELLAAMLVNPTRYFPVASR
jgi:hypothetical protein